MKIPTPTDASIILTYRCPMRCKMCDVWKNPTDPQKEIQPHELEILPKLKFINITGGEPFVRDDLEEIVKVLLTKTDRIVISSSGWYEDRVYDLFDKYPNLGIRISIEGLQETNDFLRGKEGGFEKGLRILKNLKKRGVKDLGFGITVSQSNSKDMLELYKLAKELDLEFATAAVHNSFYFHKSDNSFTEDIKEDVIDSFEKLKNMMLKESSVKSWFRAYFNSGLQEYVKGHKRLLPCYAGMLNFFIDPYGDVLPCNGMEEKYWKESMGNIREVDNFDEIWLSDKAEMVREKVRNCPKNCWMVGTAAPAMKKHILTPSIWVAKNKIKSLFK